MFTAKVYNVMVGSLSGIMEEVTFAKEVIRKWNLRNAEIQRRVFMNVEWTNNLECIQKVDLVIAIVGNWIENAELVDDFINQGKKVVLFFSAFQDPKNTIPCKHDEVKSFRERVLGKCRCVEYRSAAELKELVKEVLHV